MTKTEAAAVVQARVACALIEMEGMRSWNQHCVHIGAPPGYSEGSFQYLIQQHEIDDASVQKILNGAT